MFKTARCAVALLALLAASPALADDEDVCGGQSATDQAIIAACSRLIARHNAKTTIEARADDYYYRGFAYWQSMELDKALADATKAIEIRPHIDAYRLRAMVYEDLKQPANALADVKKALSTFDTGRASVLALRGDIYADGLEFEWAMADYAAAIKEDPKSVDAYFGRGRLHKDRGALDKSLEDLDRAVALNAKDWNVLILRGIIRARLGNHAGAIEDFNRSIKGDAKRPSGNYLQRGLSHRARGDRAKAEADFRKAIDLATTEIAAKEYLALSYSNRSEAYAGLGEFQNALADINKAVALTPEDSLVYLDRGKAELASGKRDQAAASFKRALALPDSRGVEGLSHAGASAALRSMGIEPPEPFIQRRTLPPPVTPPAPLTWVFTPLSTDQSTTQRPASGTPPSPVASAAPNPAPAPTPPAAQTRPPVPSRPPPAAAATPPSQSAPPAVPAVVAAATPPAASPPSPPPVAAGPAAAAPAPTPSASPALRRVALVIGNSAYKQLSALPNPTRDARGVGKMLQSAGFKVIVHENLSFLDMDGAMTEFAAAATGADEILLYYAGHGMRLDGRDLLAPVDFSYKCVGSGTTQTAVNQSPITTYSGGIDLEQYIERIKAPQARKIIVVDACRTSAFPSCPVRGDEANGLSFSFRGLTRGNVLQPLIVSSTQPGALAVDGEAGKMSPFATAFTQRLSGRPNLMLLRVLNDVARDVKSATNGFQTPQVLSQGDSSETCLTGRDCVWN